MTSRDIHLFVKFGIFEGRNPGSGYTYAWTDDDLSDFLVAGRIREVAFGRGASGSWWPIAKDMLDLWRENGRPRGGFLCHCQDGPALLDEAQMLQRLGSGQGMIVIGLDGAP